MSASSQKYFNRNPSINRPRSSFDRSKGLKTTFDAGWLIPIYVDQAIPGDTMTLDFEGLARLATPIKPTMDNLYLETFFFFIPRRLTWTNFQRYMGEQDNPTDSIDYQLPQTSTPDGTGVAVMSLFDYMDIVPGVQNVPFRADILRSYNLVWNKHFRDENLQNSVPQNMGDGPDAITDYELLRRGKRADYFTTALKTPQKGPTVMIPGSDLPVHGLAVDNTTTYPGAGAGYTDASGDSPPAAIAGSGWAATSTSTLVQGNATTNIPDIRVEWADNVDGTMNALRMAEAMQTYYEQLNRGGSRYVEQNLYLFGVRSPDARLQIPEFLGGGSTRVNISPVQQTSDTGAGTPQGNLAGEGRANLRNHGFSKSFTEHGIILGLLNCRADLNYQNALPRWYSTLIRDEEYFPPFSQLGDQAVLQQEIFLTDTEGERETVFGYVERFAEYKTAFSTVTGLFRSNVAGSLDVWTYVQDFDTTPPELGADFIEDNPPIDRTIAVPSQPHFLLDSFMRINHVRPIPAHSAPRLGVRF